MIMIRRRWLQLTVGGMASLSSLGAAQACRSSASDARHVTIFAASSLRDVWDQLAADFSQRNPKIELHLQYAGSQTLRLQLEHGAIADLFFSANVKHIQALAHTGWLGRRARFAATRLVVIVPADHPQSIREFSELDRVRSFVTGTSAVPIGAYTQAVLERVTASSSWGESFATAIRKATVSRETNVRLIRAKVELGEADAAIVYAPDTVTGRNLRVIEIPEAFQVPVHYHVGFSRHSGGRPAVAKLEQYLRSKLALELLARHGITRSWPL